MIEQPPLFDVPRVKGKRGRNCELVKALKAEHGVWTHNIKGTSDWLALCVPRCLAALDGYALTDEQKSDPFELYAGYGRLLDDMGLRHEGFKTELEAVQAAIKEAK